MSQPLFFLGDSITYGYGLVSVQPPSIQAGLLLNDTPTNGGVNGASTASWAENHEGTPLYNLLESIAHGTHYETVLIMLGTNDANIDGTNATDYQANLQTIITALVGAGINKIVLNQPPYLKTESLVGANTTLETYNAALANLVTANPGVVFLGDMTAYSVFAANAATYYQADGVHPNDIGATALAGLWEVAYPF